MWIAALIAGIVAMVSINNVSILLNLQSGFYLAFIVFIIMGSLIEFFSPPNTSIRLMLASAACSILAGVVIDIIFDLFIRHFERNLFPLEIIMWYIFAPIPLLVGIMSVRILRKLKEKKLTAKNNT
jgi:hypothetical protein